MKWLRLLWIFPFLLILSFGRPDKHQLYNRWDNIHFVKEIDFDPHPDTVFVICTNRLYQPGLQQPLADRADPENKLQYLVATYSNNEWRLLRKQNLEEAVAYLPRKDFLLYIEGMGKTFPMDLQRSAGMTAQYNLNVIQFEYPSIHPRKNPVANFYFAYNQAKHATEEYSEFIREFEVLKNNHPEKFAEVNVSLFHHSMGNRMLKHSLEENLLIVKDKSLFQNVILNAACVPQSKHTEWIEKIDFSERVFINYNKKDFQLNGAMFITFDKMLGARFKEPLAGNATYIDFQTLVAGRHSNFLNIDGRDNINPECRRYYDLVLHGNNPNLADSSLFITSTEIVGFGLK
ncbi:MAG TPA: alpha/beta hydrolase [Cyclobacteriaceae bacterium]|jgi:hypothetical protein